MLKGFLTGIQVYFMSTAKQESDTWYIIQIVKWLNRPGKIKHIIGEKQTNDMNNSYSSQFLS